jgi:chaperonin cofactor prefoldin
MAFKILGRSGKDLVTAGSSSDNLSAESRKIINLAAPDADTDAANKEYVDDEIAAAVGAIDVNEVLDGTFRVVNTTDPTKELAFDVSGVATATTRTIIMPNANVDLGLVASAIQSSEKGAVNGVATLNAAGKLSNSQVPAIAITETFVVADIDARDALVLGEDDGEVQEGDVAIVTDASDDVDVVAGAASYIYDGAAWQLLKTPTSAVQSVNGETGVIVLDTDDINEGSANFYYTSTRFDADLATKNTGNLAEGSNLYFTEARVLATVLTGLTAGSDAAIADTDTVLGAFAKLQAQVAAAKLAASDAQADADQALLDAAAAQGDATQALQDAAAALQAAQNAQGDIDDHINEATGAHAASAISFDNAASGLVATQVQAAIDEVEGRVETAEGDIDDLEQDVSDLQTDVSALQAESGQAFEAGVAGESFAADQVWLVRRAKDGETAGRYYKAQADSSINSRVVGFIVVGSSAVDAAGAIRVYKLGSAVLGSADAAFASAAINTPVYLSQTTAGKFTLAPSETAGEWLKEVGFVANTDSLEFQPGLLIQA